MCMVCSEEHTLNHLFLHCISMVRYVWNVINYALKIDATRSTVKLISCFLYFLSEVTVWLFVFKSS